MKNLFLEKNIVQKLIIALVIVILFNFASPTMCNAKGFLASAGGKLLVPVMELIVGIADAVLNVLQTSLLSNLEIITPATSAEEKEVGWGILKVIGVVLCVAVIVVAVVVTGGTIIAAGAAVGSAITATTGVVATATAIAAAIPTGAAGTIVGSLAIGGAAAAGAHYLGKSAVEDFKGEFDLPTIVYTPFAIFSGIVPLFDINFFNPSTELTQVVNSADLFANENSAKVENTLEANEVDSETVVDVKDKINNAADYELYNYVSTLATWGGSFTYYYDYLEETGGAEAYEKLEEGDATFIKNQIKSWIESGILFVEPAWIVFKKEGVNKSNSIDENLKIIAGNTVWYLDFWTDETVQIKNPGEEVKRVAKRKKIDITSTNYIGLDANYTMFMNDERRRRIY